MKLYAGTIFIALMMSLFSQASTIDIGVLTSITPKSVTVKVVKGKYDIEADNTVLGSLYPNETAKVFYKEGKIFIQYKNSIQGPFTQVNTRALTWSSYFKVTCHNPQVAYRTYDDNLKIQVDDNHLLLINNVDLDKYVAGVIEAESGIHQNLEYYKVQAIISRTYALSNKRKFIHKGYNLNDEVASQVYHGKAKHNFEIIKAAFQTKGIVMVDSDIKLTTAAFHSNCGGETVNSEHVWTKPLPYLTGICDDTWQSGKHAYWSKTIKKEAWFDYLNSNFNYQPKGVDEYLSCLNFEQEKRTLHYMNSSILLKKIRTDWNLKSTFFRVEYCDLNDSIVLMGKGFGHGIGLSQEGAMALSKQGYSYLEILNYYYTDVHVINLESISFFRED